ncbi:hypothetical protein OsJ_35438 [Oryza sativa Japonica Group]|uniref:Uncharacterized protein n=2 Tax=Oryza sativa subsp. japonica TaxID=39947 RepID=A0A8J8XGE4_ORYSJ|nr:hypothetical protein LOC_Os12g08120 [Oryza sativa Japonica Group]EAZ19853.1 hypothetical protein OsJ_35438 [Oryza sativa Japonica Group]
MTVGPDPQWVPSDLEVVAKVEAGEEAVTDSGIVVAVRMGMVRFWIEPKPFYMTPLIHGSTGTTLNDSIK